MVNDVTGIYSDAGLGEIGAKPVGVALVVFDELAHRVERSTSGDEVDSASSFLDLGTSDEIVLDGSAIFHCGRQKLRNPNGEHRALEIPDKEYSLFRLSDTRIRKAPCGFWFDNSLLSAGARLIFPKYHLRVSFKCEIMHSNARQFTYGSDSMDVYSTT